MLLLAFLLGAMVGTTFVGYLFYAWVPATLILRDAPPSYLKFDPKLESAQYRDLYVAYVARRFVEMGGDNLALQEALALLGVSSGDVSLDEAREIVRSTKAVADRESAQMVGRLLFADAANTQALLMALESAQPPSIAPAQPRQTVRVAGAALTLVILIAALVALRLLQGAAISSAAAAAVATVGPSAGVSAASSAVPSALQSSAVQTPSAAPPTSEFSFTAEENAPRAPSTPSMTARPLQHFTSTYLHGDETFEEAFEVLADSGELLGECTVSIGDRFGLASPSQVIALSVSLFEKIAMRSVTHVLLTPFAFHNSAIYAKMSEVGTPVLAEAGMTFNISIGSLRAEVAVRELSFGRIGNQAQGYFERVVLDIRVFTSA